MCRLVFSPFGRLVAAGLLAMGAFGASSTLPCAQAKEPPADAQPFPTNKTTTVRGRGTTWVIDGPQVIPRGVEIRVELGTTIVGINTASLDVQGGLKIHGTQDNWVIIEDVDFSPTKEPEEDVHLDMADFVRCTFAHGEDGYFLGNFTIENSCFQRGCVFDVRIRGGFLKIMTTEFGDTCTIHCDRAVENRVPIEVEIRSSWMKAVALSGPGDVNVRHSEIKGGIKLASVTNTTVDGCDISVGLSIAQGPLDSYKKIRLTKCNLFDGAKVVLERKGEEDARPERVRLDKFYFGPEPGSPGIVGKREVAALIQDGKDAPDGKGLVAATWSAPKKRKHVLVSYWPLRERPPPLR